MGSLPGTPITEEQYLELERVAETKSEFHHGEMYAMAGGTPTHALLANRIGVLLDRQMSAGCRTFNSDLRIKADTHGLYTYADCAVVCGPLEHFAKNPDVVLNPLLLVEVLSPSTENYDRGKKFEMYRSIPSFREYLIVHQDRPHVEHYSKQEDGSWVLREYIGEVETVAIPRLKVVISLAELYANAFDLT